MEHYEEILNKISPIFHKLIQYANYFNEDEQTLTYWSYITEIYHFPKNIPYWVFSDSKLVRYYLILPLKTGDYYCNISFVKMQDNKIIDRVAENDQEHTQYIRKISLSTLQKGGLWSVRTNPVYAELYIIDTILNNFFNYCWEDQEKIAKFIIAMIGIDTYETIRGNIK